MGRKGSKTQSKRRRLWYAREGGGGGRVEYRVHLLDIFSARLSCSRRPLHEAVVQRHIQSPRVTATLCACTPTPEGALRKRHYRAHDTYKNRTTPISQLLTFPYSRSPEHVHEAFAREVEAETFIPLLSDAIWRSFRTGEKRRLKGNKVRPYTKQYKATPPGAGRLCKSLRGLPHLVGFHALIVHLIQQI